MEEGQSGHIRPSPVDMVGQFEEEIELFGRDFYRNPHRATTLNIGELSSTSGPDDTIDGILISNSQGFRLFDDLAKSFRRRLRAAQRDRREALVRHHEIRHAMSRLTY